MGKAYSNSGIFRVLLRQVYDDVRDNDALASRFSWHLLRRGGATWATRCRVSQELVLGHGIWSLLGIQPYLAADSRAKLSVTRAM
eukprot:3375375-Rhodomonas_salina.2